ncbi:MAG TPA: GxxExxY protein [Paludibacteraceae bacterium]|nr:GxxExxY protein [Paludibacteraceae bacterium]
MADLICKKEVFDIVGAAMAVHRELKNGFLEAVYGEALSVEFKEENIPFEREKALPVYYKGRLLNKKYFADFVCYDSIILEIKAAESLLPEHEAQLLNYMHVTHTKVGILINFGEKSLKYRRLIL